jgi:phenylacetate-CoA ligase
MFIIRGENIYPSAIDSALNEIAGYGGEHRIVITREGAMDELLVRIDATEAVYAKGEAALADLRRRAEAKLQTVLGVRARIEVVAAGAIPRTDFKARRVVDDRDLFRSLKQSLGA